MACRRAREPVGRQKLAKRSQQPRTRLNPPRPPAGRLPRPGVVHSSVYLPEAVYEALRETAFKERLKIHDLIMQGIDLALRKRGYPSVETLRSRKRRKAIRRPV